MRKSLHERIRDRTPRPLVRAVHAARWRRHRAAARRYLDEQARAGTHAFIHINKCGGTSVEQALGIPVKLHDTAAERRDRIGAARWEALHSFSIVRHPAERLTSQYRYLLRIDWQGMGRAPPGLDAWIEDVLGAGPPRMLSDRRLVMPCLDWLTDAEGRVIVNEIARLETIADDWPGIAARIGTDAALPLKNRTHRENGDVAALSPGTLALIRGAYARDLDAFGYEI